MNLKHYFFAIVVATIIPVVPVKTQGMYDILTDPSTAQGIILGVSPIEKISSSIITEEEIVSIDNIIIEVKETKKKEKKKEEAIENRWDIKLSNNEIDLLAKILWVEARGESNKGQQAVVEVVFNRMIHKEEFAGSLEDVLSARNQFSSWNSRDSAKPTDKEYKNIEKVLSGNTEITNLQVVYFSTSPRNDIGVIHIGGHYFCEYEKQ